jgi:hypothetical protein
MAKRADRVAFSAEVKCRYGSGVNIFAESAWGNHQVADGTPDEISGANTRWPSCH